MGSILFRHTTRIYKPALIHDSRTTKMGNIRLVSLGSDEYQLPPTEETHIQLVRSAIRQERDLCIISPTLRQEYLDRHTLAGLFEMMGMDRRAVMIMSRNSDIRDRYERMKGAFEYSTGRWPLASVKSDGSLAHRTHHYVTEDAPPAVIYAKWATRLPNSEHADEIQAVLYDEGVGFDEERFDEFQEWRENAEIPTVVYYIRDPLGQTYDRISGEVDTTWAWSLPALNKVISAEQSEETDVSHENNEVVPSCTKRERDHLQRKVDGQSYEARICPPGTVTDQFSRLWEAYQEFDSTVNEVGTKLLKFARYYLKDTISAFSRNLSNLSQSNIYRAQHAMATTLSGRVGALRQMKSNLSGDSQAGGTGLQNAIYDLEDLCEMLDNDENLSWKRGRVLSEMLNATDNNESLIIVAPDDPEAEALRADMYINRKEFWLEAQDSVTIQTPSELTRSYSADRLMLYGPPKYSDRWLLRSPHGGELTILTYPHELGLLFSQASNLNSTMNEATPHKDDILNSQEGSILKELEEELPSVELPPSEDNSSPTVASPGIDGIRINIPDEDETSSGSSTFKNHESKDPNKRERLRELIEQKNNVSNSSNGQYQPTHSGSDNSKQSTWSRRDIDGCIELVAGDGYRMADKPNASVEVVRMDAKVRTSKSLREVNVGEYVVSVRDRMEIRTHVERQLYDMGEASIVVKANKWKDLLQREIDLRDHSFEDFVEQMNSTEITPKNKSTYRDWYHGEVTMPKSKDSLYYIADAYDLDEIKNQLDECWNANRTIRRVKSELIDKWLDEAQEELLSEDMEVKDLLRNDQGLDIRVSDFEKFDEDNEPLVLAHKVTSIEHGVTRSYSYLGRWRST